MNIGERMTVTGASRWTVLQNPGWLTPGRRRAVRHGIIISGLLVAAIAGAMSYFGPTVDAHAYWINRPPLQYGLMPGQIDAYLYTPVFGEVLAPITTWLPFAIFKALWLVLIIGTLRWLTGPLLLLPAVILFYTEIECANIHFLIAAAIVLGFRYPATWALMLLTKVTPGVGLIWFAVRREWRKLAIALGATAVIAAASFAFSPQAWFDYIAFIGRGLNYAPPTALLPGPFWLRAAVAAMLVAVAGVTNRRWLVPVAAVIALPHGTIGIAMMAAVIPLWRQRAERGLLAKTTPAPALEPIVTPA